MSFHLQKTKTSLEKWCHFLDEAISKADKRHKESVSQDEAQRKYEISTYSESVDLTEIDKLLAKARTVRVDVEKSSKQDPFERKTHLRDQSKKKLVTSRSARAVTSSVPSTKEKALQTQREQTEKIKRSVSGIARRPTNQQTVKDAREVKNAKAVKHKVDTINEKFSTMSIDASSSKKDCPGEEKPIACDSTTKIDPVRQRLLEKLNKVSVLKRKMIQSKSRCSIEASNSRYKFVTDAEAFFTDKSEISQIYERSLSEGLSEASPEDHMKKAQRFGLRVRNKIGENKESITKQVISYLHDENSSLSLKELQSAIDLILDYEQLKIDTKLNELVSRLSKSIFQSTEISKSGKLIAYRRLYGILFEDGERLPTLINDTEESEKDCESDN